MNTFDYIKKSLKNAVIESFMQSGEEIIWVEAVKLSEVVAILKNELGFDILLDIIAIDWWVTQQKRFQLDYLFFNTKENQRVHLKVSLLENKNPEIETVSGLFGSADWAERECFDMMGIRFKNHPNLKRLLMWTEFEGHPLRKDYPLEKRQPIPVLDKLL
jgi:NADH-quinone oxidoreductase subunit C